MEFRCTYSSFRLTLYSASLKLALLCLALFFGQKHGIAQKDGNVFFVVADSVNLSPIPYVPVKILHKNQGTLSNLKGECRLSGVQPQDSIVISAFGYEKMVLSLRDVVELDTIFLNEEYHLLEEVIVLGDNSFLYDMLDRCAPNKTVKMVTKSYYELETHIENVRAEKIQAYYTGSVKGYDCEDLKLKNMRFGALPINQRLFTSVEVSKSFYYHSLFDPSDYFPENPFQLSKGKLKRSYWLVLRRKYTDREKRVIYQVGFKPKKDTTMFFSGDVWIDSASNELLKIDLIIKNAQRYPFSAFWSIHSLESVDLFLSKTFKKVNGSSVLSSVNFEYDLTYIGDYGAETNVKTSAVLDNYQFNEQFFNPVFDFQPAENRNSELLKLTIIEENEQFWSCMREFRSSSDFIKDSLFYYNDSVISIRTIMAGEIFQSKHFFEKPYAAWGADKRVFFRTNDSLQASVHREGFVPANSYDLTVQIFVDITDNCGNRELVMTSFLDPFSSFYNLPVTNATNAFINIYFDLMELQRRKYEKKIIAVLDDADKVNGLIVQMKEENDSLKSNYFKGVQRGTNKNELKKWNQHVLDELGIDNMKLFGVPE